VCGLETLELLEIRFRGQSNGERAVSGDYGPGYWSQVTAAQGERERKPWNTSLPSCFRISNTEK
jgi:hypothetical protein